MSNDAEGEVKMIQGREKTIQKKRKRKNNAGEKKKENAKRTKTAKGLGSIVSVDQLAWRKISLQNDEFDDFEEIEGVDVEHVKKDGQDVIQFKVFLSQKVLIGSC